MDSKKALSTVGKGVKETGKYGKIPEFNVLKMYVFMDFDGWKLHKTRMGLPGETTQVLTVLPESKQINTEIKNNNYERNIYTHTK